MQNIIHTIKQATLGIALLVVLTSLPIDTYGMRKGGPSSSHKTSNDQNKGKEKVLEVPGSSSGDNSDTQEIDNDFVRKPLSEMPTLVSEDAQDSQADEATPGGSKEEKGFKKFHELDPELRVMILCYLRTKDLKNMMFLFKSLTPLAREALLYKVQERDFIEVAPTGVDAFCHSSENAKCNHLIKRISLRPDTTPITYDILKRLELLHNLTELRLLDSNIKLALYNTDITVESLITEEALAGLPSTLTRLDLGCCPSSVLVKGLETIAHRCPKLEELKLDGTSIPEESAASFPTLTRLRLTNCNNITSSSLKVIAQKYPNLSNLCLSPCMGLTSLAGIEDLTQLEELGLYNTGITDEALGFLPSSVTKLDLGWCKSITEKGLENLAQRCPDLQKLDLRYCAVTSFAGIDKCANITHINLSNCSKLNSLTGIEKCTQLTDLNLLDTHTTEDLASLKSLACLKRLRTPEGRLLEGEELKEYLNSL